jgi:hypothetical protein
MQRQLESKSYRHDPLAQCPLISSPTKKDCKKFAQLPRVGSQIDLGGLGCVRISLVIGARGSQCAGIPSSLLIAKTDELPVAKLKRKLCSTYFRMPHAIAPRSRALHFYKPQPARTRRSARLHGNDERSLRIARMAPYPSLSPPMK